MARLQTRYGDILVVIYTGNPTTINAIFNEAIATRTMPYHPTTSEEWRIVARHMNSVIDKLIPLPTADRIKRLIQEEDTPCEWTKEL